MKEEIAELKYKLIEQEHRVWYIIFNLFTNIFDSNKKKRNASIKAFVFNLILSKTTIIIGLLGYIGYYIDWQNNQLLKSQNEIIKEQNLLSDASRRGGMNFLLSDIFSKIDSEIKQCECKTLSNNLVAQIISLSNSLKPYYSIRENNNEKLLLSPERGYLLSVLSLSDINKETLEHIYQLGNFRFSDLENVHLQNSHLKYVDISNSNLINAKINLSDLSYSNLSDCILDGTQFYKTDLTESKIKSSLDSVNFGRAILKNCDFYQSKIYNSNFSYSTLDSTNFSDVKMIGNYFFNTDLSKAIVHRLTNEPKPEIYQEEFSYIDLITLFDNLNCASIYDIDTIHFNDITVYPEYFDNCSQYKIEKMRDYRTYIKKKVGNRVDGREL